MKNSELVNIFKKGNLVIPMYILENYKKLDINMEEFVFLMYLYNSGNRFIFDPGKFSNDLGIDLSDIMNYIGVLTDKHFIRVEVIKNDKGIMDEVIILDDFYNKLTFIVMDKVNDTDKSSDSTIFEVIEKEFGRTLSPMEYEIIKAWLDNNISEELIKEAIKEATFNGVSNLRYIDKILYEWGKNNITNIKELDSYRKKRKKKVTEEENVDLDIVDWDWFEDE